MAHIDNNGITYMKGQNNGLFINCSDFLYKRQDGHFPNTKWLCTTKKCNAFLWTKNWIFQANKSECQDKHHNHFPHKEKIRLWIAKEEIRRRILRDLHTPVSKIVEQVKVQFLLEDEEMLPMNKKNADSQFQKFRRKQYPTPPTSLSEIKIEQKWQMDFFGKSQYLQIDDGTDEKILGFFTEFGLRRVCKSKHVVADGTFKVMPTIFRQLYVFHGETFGKFLPYLFFLLPDKSEETYKRMIKLLTSKANDLGFHFSPEYIHLDYEMAMINACKLLLPDTKVQGCLFHFTQCIWRKVQDLGFSTEYKNKSDVREWVRRFSALPFLPEIDIFDGFDELQQLTPVSLRPNKIRKFLDYMVETWIDEVDGLYSRDLWNQYTNVGPRTTNNAEGWHTKLNSTAGNRHLTLYPFITLLRHIQADTLCTYNELIPMSTNHKSPLSLKIDESIANSKTKFNLQEISRLDFLDAVSGLLKLE